MFKRRYHALSQRVIKSSRNKTALGGIIEVDDIDDLTPARVKKIYVIGSLRNKGVPDFVNKLRKLGFDAFAEWHGAGPRADQYIYEYHKALGRDYKQSVQSAAAQWVFQFDFNNLNDADLAVILMKAGKAAHIEAGYMIGKGKPVYAYFPEGYPSRMDVMYNFLTGMFDNERELFTALKSHL